MSSEDDSSFSIDEIRRQLQALGYDHVNDERLHQFQSDLSRLMTTSNNSGCTTPKNVGAGDADYVSKPTMPRFDAFDPYSETSTDSSVAEPTDITSYNPLPDVQVPREVYIDDDLERTLDNIQKLDFSNIEDDLDNFRLKEPQINTDSESVKTEDLLLLSDKSKVKRMKRKISRKIEYGDGSDSFVTVTESTLSDENRSILSDFSELDSELRDRLNRLKKNLGRERKAFKDASNQVMKNMGTLVLAVCGFLV